MSQEKEYVEETLQRAIRIEAELNNTLQTLKISKSQWAHLKRLQNLLDKAVDEHNYWQERLGERA